MVTEFTVLRSNWISQLQLIYSSSSKAHVGSESRALLRVKGRMMELISGDGASQISTSFELFDAIGTMNVAVSAKKLYDICRVLSDEHPINGRLSKDKLTLSSHNLEAELLVLPEDSIPLLPVHTPEVTLEVGVEKLRRLVNSVQFAMAHQDVRHYLNGFLIKIHGEMLTGVATDGHRLAYGEEGGLKCVGDRVSHSLLLPRRSVHDLLKCLDFMDTEHCRLSYGANTVSCSNESIGFDSQLLLSVYPSYDSAINMPLTYFFEAKLLGFKQALLRSMALAANEKPRKITLEIDDENISLVTVNTQQERLQESLTLSRNHLKGLTTKIGFDIKYLLDILQVLKGDEIRMSFNDQNSLSKIVSVDEPSYQYVVMPML